MLSKVYDILLVSLNLNCHKGCHSQAEKLEHNKQLDMEIYTL